MLGNYTLDHVVNYLITKFCHVNLVSTFVLTFDSSSISVTFNCVGLMRKEQRGLVCR